MQKITTAKLNCTPHQKTVCIIKFEHNIHIAYFIKLREKKLRHLFKIIYLGDEKEIYPLQKFQL